MTSLPPTPGDGANERVSRAQELSQERVRNGQLRLQVVALESQLAEQATRRDRSNSARFIALCTLVALGLGALVYLQIDSTGSGQLRTGLVRQCEQRNVNLEILTSSWAKQAAVARGQGDFANAEILESLTTAFQQADCSELR